MADALVVTPSLAKYSGLDLDTIRDEVLSALVARGGRYNNFAESDPGRILIEGFAIIFDQLSFYLDRRATNLYLETVRVLREASFLARHVGYKVSPAIAASVDFTIALKAVQTFDFLLPAGTPIPGPRGLTYELARDTTFVVGSGPSNSQTVPAYEGITVIETFFGNGRANQTYSLFRVTKGKYIVIGTVDVTVDGQLWTEEDLLSTGANNAYAVNYAADPPELIFGDGVVGASPAQGRQIKVSYVVSSGVNGKVAKQQINTTIKVAQSFTQVELTVVNPAQSIGGDGMESLASVQANAGRRFRAREAASTSGDYEALANGFSHPLFGRVAAARAYSPRSAAADVTLNNQLLTIRSEFANYGPAIQALVTSVETEASNISDQLALQTTSIADIGAKVEATQTKVDSSVESSRTVRSSLTEVASLSSRVSSVGADLGVAVGDISVGGTDSLTTATRAALLDLITTLSSYAVSMQSSASAGLSSMESVLADLSAMGLNLGAVGTAGDDADTLLETLESQRASIATSQTATDALLVSIDTASSTETDAIDTACASIYDHVDKMLADNCKVNLVEVPILSRDSSGNLVAPTLGLIGALQEKLDLRKNASHTVSVTSGGNQLVPAVVEVTATIRKDFRETVSQRDIEAAVKAVIQAKFFNMPLYLDQVYRAVESVAGLAFFNVEILGNLDRYGVLTAERLDPHGNLIVSAFEVVSVGTITITTETE